MLEEIVVLDWLPIKPVDSGEYVAPIRDNRVTAVEIVQDFFAADAAARTRP